MQYPADADGKSKTRGTGTVAELMSPVARLASDSDGSIKKTGLRYIKIGLSYIKLWLSNYARFTRDLRKLITQDDA